jgi:ribosomal-protein-alanine N-acetyltransferase
MIEIQTPRLRLISLNEHQLRCLLETPRQLEENLAIPFSRTFVSDAVKQAIETKLGKISEANIYKHPWFTYWLVVVATGPYGAGLVGFKGYPNSRGEAEIGYGMDPAYRNKGYTTEAVRVLIAWAFEEPDCCAVTAQVASRDNLPSIRVLEKVGMHIYEEVPPTTLWRIDRGNCKDRQN